jgi:hypothetical protein
VLLTVRRLTVTAGAAGLLLLYGCVAPAPTVPPTPARTCTPAADRPPLATMLDASGAEVAGRPGGFFCGEGTAAPTPPDAASPSVQLTNDDLNVVISAPDGSSFKSWLAYVNRQGIDAPGAIKLIDGESETGVETLSFHGPGSGDWILVFNAAYRGGTGARYTWNVNVP